MSNSNSQPSTYPLNTSSVTVTPATNTNVTGTTIGQDQQQRRMSSAAGGCSVVASTSSPNDDCSPTKENKRPLVTVLSEDRIGQAASGASASITAAVNNNNTNSQHIRQSFFSKFTRTESGSNKQQQNLVSGTSFTKTNVPQKKRSQDNEYLLKKSPIDQMLPSPSSSIFRETECDKQQPPPPPPPNADHQRPIEQTALPSTVSKTSITQLQLDEASSSQRFDKMDNDDDQVLPAWPSRIEAFGLEPAIVQHQVYSLKDYSQVSGPTANTAGAATSSASSGALNSGRLLKSMSQDRKMKSTTKRMSECIYPGVQQISGEFIDNNMAASSKHRNPSVSGQITSSSGLSMAPTTSVNSLLTPSSSTKNTTLLSELRIDRMRKLFVSPLSLRSSGSGSKVSAGTSHHQTATTNNPRLSFQSASGANMLNKPQHLMHAMYRTRVGGAHHSRRSPLRQKQGVKSFRVYGCPLQMANNIYPITCFGRSDIYKQQSVPYILARLCNYIEENSSQLTHEGIFRVSGNARLMEKLRTLFDHIGDAPLESESVDVATSASMLKMYLRELPEPLIPTRMNYYFITLAKKYSSLLSKENSSAGFSRIQDNLTAATTSSTGAISVDSSTIASDLNQTALDRQRIAYLRDLTKLVRKLPVENYNLLKYLACFLYRISLKQQYNKMCAEALGIVFGPNVFRIRSESYKGLKEQELSNQIMASIISNYKSIFDCELTDPLGNLIKSNENINIGIQDGDRDGDGGGGSRRTNQSSGTQALESTECSNFSKTSCSIGGAGAVISNDDDIASISCTNESQIHSRDCCPKHGRVHFYHDDKDRRDNEGGIRHHHGQVSDTDEVYGCDEDEEDDDDNDDDDDDDDDESYSPTSGSESYCSSIDSDSVESTYDGATEPDQYGDNENFDMASRSSSECGSATSYTPSSSHSDSDTHNGDESFYGKSSSFDSSTSIKAADIGDDDENVDAVDGPNKLPIIQRPCQVCKRRESLQVESFANDEKKPSYQSKDQQEKSNIPSPGNKEDKHIQIQSKNSNKESPRSRSRDTNVDSSSSQNGLTTTRKRRSDDGKKMTSTSSSTSHQNKPPTSEMTTSKTSPSSLLSDHRRSSGSSKSRADPSGERGTKHHEKSRQTHRHNFSRRRSSSASSLLRIKHKHNQIVQNAQRKMNDDGHHHRAKGHSDRKRYHDVRGGGGGLGPRKSRNKSHLLSRTSRGEQQRHGSESTRANSSKYSSEEWHQSCRNKEQKEKQRYTPELSALDLSAGLGKDLVWDFMSASYIEVPECERYFYLRPFNSDETLFRSPEFNNEFNQEIESSRARRRFSGHEHFDNKDAMLPVCPPFNQIFEGFEGETLLDIDRVNRANIAPFETSNFHKLEPDSIPVEASVISLIDNKLNSNFRQSKLSINEGSQEIENDPLLDQLKATKDLIKALKKLQKYGSSRGYSGEMEGKISQLYEDSSLDYSDDCSTSYVDYLAAKGLVESLDELNQEDTEEENYCPDPIKQNQLNCILNEKIVSFKQRYNDLKNVREHYMKNHANNIAAGGHNDDIKHDTEDRLESRKATSSSKLIDPSLDLASQQRGVVEAATGDTVDLSKSNGDGSSSAGEQVSEYNQDMTKAQLCANKPLLEDQDHQVKSLETSPKIQIELDQSTANTIRSTQRYGGGGDDGSGEEKEKGNEMERMKLSKCKFGSLCPVEFVFNIEKQLAMKRVLGDRLIKLNEMSLEQLQSEKLELQKNLLRYEHWFGRPTSRLEFSLIGHLYERYRAVKIIKLRKQQQRP